VLSNRKGGKLLDSFSPPFFPTGDCCLKPTSAAGRFDTRPASTPFLPLLFPIHHEDQAELQKEGRLSFSFPSFFPLSLPKLTRERRFIWESAFSPPPSFLFSSRCILILKKYVGGMPKEELTEWGYVESTPPSSPSPPPFEISYADKVKE